MDIEDALLDPAKLEVAYDFRSLILLNINLIFLATNSIK